MQVEKGNKYHSSRIQVAKHKLHDYKDHNSAGNHCVVFPLYQNKIKNTSICTMITAYKLPSMNPTTIRMTTLPKQTEKYINKYHKESRLSRESLCRVFHPNKIT